MATIDKTDFYQNRWHFGVLEHIEVTSVPDSATLGEEGAKLFAEYFRKNLPLQTSAMVPDFTPAGFTIGGTVRVWVGIEVHRNKYVALLVIGNVRPYRQGHENICFSSEHRGGLVILEDELCFTYNAERQLFLCERVP